MKVTLGGGLLGGCRVTGAGLEAAEEKWSKTNRICALLLMLAFFLSSGTFYFYLFWNPERLESSGSLLFIEKDVLWWQTVKSIHTQSCFISRPSACLVFSNTEEGRLSQQRLLLLSLASSRNWKVSWLESFSCVVPAALGCSPLKLCRKFEGNWVMELEWISAKLRVLWKSETLSLKLKRKNLSCCFENLWGEFLHGV